MPEKTGSSNESVKMKDANGSEGKLIKDQSQKPQSNDIKCAEIKVIPSVMNGYGDRQRKVFKMGEYNRATASFEINTPDREIEPRQKIEFDLSSEIAPSHYFKSSFARSMVVNNASRSKSLDYNLVNRNGLKEDKPKDERKCLFKEESDARQREDTLWQIPGKENWDLRKAQPAEIRDDLSSAGSIASDHRQRNKKSDVIEEHLGNQPMLLERPGSRGSSAYQRSVSSYSDRRFDEVLLRSPLTASCRSSYYRPYSSAGDVDTVLLQSQVTTLQWQLRHAESSLQMHRTVLEQVVTFLQRTQKNLDQLQNRILDGDVAKINRVPRSRSVHGVDMSPSRLSESNLSFQKAKSVAQIADPYCPKHGNVYRDMTWRRPRKQHYDPEDLTPSKLSEEAFRLLRTVQSLLNAREPDLSSRLSNGLSTICSSPGHPAEVSSASSTVSAALDSDHSDNFQSQETLRNRTPIQDQFAEEPTKNGPRSSRSRTNQRNSYQEKNSPPQLSISSADDESGFSSLNSFQEIGLPVSNSTFNGVSKAGNYHPEMMKNGIHHPEEGANLQEVGLPRVDEVACKIHRRWSSTPADNHIAKIRSPSLSNGEILRVLWV